MDLLTKIIIAVVLFGFTTANSSDKLIAENIAQAQFTTQIVKRMPIDNIKRLDSGYKGIYFFVDIRDCKGCDVVHQWWYKGKMISSVGGRAKYPRYRWWSKKTLNDNFLGDLTVKVLIDGANVYDKTVTYYKVSRKQKFTRPIKNRMQIQEAGECELQLRYFSGKVKESPEDTYFKFMLNKWGKRCIPD